MASSSSKKTIQGLQRVAVLNTLAIAFSDSPTSPLIKLRGLLRTLLQQLWRAVSFLYQVDRICLNGEKT